MSNDKVKQVLKEELGADDRQAEGLAEWVFDTFEDCDAEKLRAFLAQGDARLYRDHDAFMANEDEEDIARGYISVYEDASYGVVVWNV